MARSRRVNTEPTRTGPMKIPRRSSGATVQAPRQRPASSAANTFSTRPGRRSRRLKRLVVRSKQRQVGEVVEALAATPGDRVGGQRQRSDGLDRPGREASREQRLGMASPPAWGAGCRAAAECVVEQPEQRHAEHVDRPSPQLGVEQVEIGPVVEQRERRQGDQRAGDEDRTGREGERSAPVVLAREPGPLHVAQPRTGEGQGDRGRERQPGEPHRTPGPATGAVGLRRRSGSRRSAEALIP